MTRDVVVIGAGISGLAAACYLRNDQVRVTVLDKATDLGGHLRVSAVAGLPVDEGAESLLNRRPEAVQLAHDVGLGPDIVHPADVPAGVWSRGVIRPLPSGTVMGVPGDPAALAGLLDPAEIARVAEERTLPGMPLTTDVSVGQLVADRMGPAVAERLVEPLLGGVYAGHADKLSLQATIPVLARAAATEGSLLAATEAVQRGGDPTELPTFAGIRGGVGRLPAAVAASSGATVNMGVTVRGLSHRARWLVETGAAPRPEILEADGVVVAVPPSPAARLLERVAPVAAAKLEQIEQASVGIVTLALPVSAFPAAPAWSGFLVPPSERRTMKAVTFSSVKWPWLGELAGDLIVLRASVGRNREVADLQRGDDELVDVVLGELNDALGVSGRPVDARVARWGGGLPQYAVGHVDRVATIRTAIDAVPGLAVCGAAYDGVGVAACVAGAREAATRVLTNLGVVPVSHS